MNRITRFSKAALGASLITTVSVLTACGGGSGSAGVNRLGTVSFGVTDAPVTDAKKVLVGFKQVQIKHEDSDPETLDVTDDGSALVIDLLTLQGAQQTTLIEDARVKAGQYQWIRFIVDTNETKIVFEDGDINSDEDDDIRTLTVPSGRIQLVSGFVVPADGVVNYTIDFDLRHSLVSQPITGQYKLKPVLRITDNSETGHIAGSIDNDTYDGCADINGDANNVAMTLFSNEYEAGEFDDADSDSEVMNILDDADDPEPMTAGIVSDTAGDHTFEIGYVTAGTYKLVLTCGSDDPLADDDDSGNLAYEAYTTVTVVAGETAQVDEDDLIANPQ